MTHDVAVLGLGPAGRALAHRLVAAGASVLAIDPSPQRPWRPTYGGWREQIPGWLGTEVIGASSDRTDLIARSRHRLPGTYVVLDNEALQTRLGLGGATVRAEHLSAEQARTLDARVVVDCRGNLRGAASGVPIQTAHGLKLPADVGRTLLGEGEGEADAVLMDWRPFDGTSGWGGRRPSFCYVIPLPDGRVLAEETCLAGRPPIERTELAHRLGVRLSRAGVDARHWRGAEVERVHIPMLPPPAEVPNRFGAAGAEVNPITGYSVFASLAAVDDAARSLLATGSLPDVPRPWRRIALEALLQLDGRGTVDLFDAYGRLPQRAQRAVLDPHSSQPDLLAALGRQWALMTPRGRLALVTATARGWMPTLGQRR
ncbi:lycopene cyclase family protein [Luteococcus sanguinis]|uniref:Lycopene cyclase family protein n=1 Tax=Luteococcus sanguinis TaxID=174038 RepID=A0ABW1X1L8_9ACTN